MSDGVPVCLPLSGLVSLLHPGVLSPKRLALHILTLLCDGATHWQ